MIPSPPSLWGHFAALHEPQYLQQARLLLTQGKPYTSSSSCSCSRKGPVAFDFTEVAGGVLEERGEGL